MFFLLRTNVLVLKNPRIAEVRKALWKSSSPDLLEQFTQGCVQSGLEYIQDWNIP